MQIETSFNRAYFKARMERNRQLAARSSDSTIRDLHLKYVRLYEQLMEAPQPA